MLQIFKVKQSKSWLFATFMVSRLNLVKSGFEHCYCVHHHTVQICCGRVRAPSPLRRSSFWALCSCGVSWWKLFPRPPLRNPTLVCASRIRQAVIPAQEVTLREKSAIWASKVLVPVFCYRELAPDPIHHLSNVSTGMDVALQGIPKNGQKPTSNTFFSLKIVDKLEWCHSGKCPAPDIWCQL